MERSGNNQSGGEEEFKFVDDREAPSFQSAAKVTTAAVSMDAGRKRKLFMVVGVVIAIFCLYKLYGLFSSTPPSSMEKAMKPVAKIAAVAPTPPPAKPAATTSDAVPYATQDYAAQAQTTAPATSLTAANNDKLTTLSQAADSNRVAIQDLQAQVSGLTSGMSAVQNDLSILKQQLQTLQTSVTAAKEHTEKKIIRHKAPKVIVPSVTYYVKAMIQGRAWLMTPDGNTFTISEGDTLPGYGIVQTIEPDNGVVMTSSGRVITFKPEDR